MNSTSTTWLYFKCAHFLSADPAYKNWTRRSQFSTNLLFSSDIHPICIPMSSHRSINSTLSPFQSTRIHNGIPATPTNRARRLWWSPAEIRWGTLSWWRCSRSRSSRHGRRWSRIRRRLVGRTATVWERTRSVDRRPAGRSRCDSRRPTGGSCLVVDSLTVITATTNAGQRQSGTR